MRDIPFTIASLRALYRAGTVTPLTVAAEAMRRAQNPDHPHVWITLLPREGVMEYASRLNPERFDELPLYGVPFAIKDNIDLADVPTTCACPAFTRTPSRSATVVERLIAAGAIPIGKTNLDQFATGLVGTRTPYGVCHSVFDSRYISGGSSSGSGVAVASGMVAFALGTDTAGSGRVPAAFNHIVGLKPTRGLLSTRGVFPACRSLDCVSIFAGTCADAQAVMNVAESQDDEDAYSRRRETVRWSWKARVGLPPREQWEFFGDAEAQAVFEQTIAELGKADVELVEFDFTPFRDAAQLLYSGPWVAERRWALGDFLTGHGEALDPTVRGIISEADRYRATEAFDGMYRLEALRRKAAREWTKMDAMLLPTTGTIYSTAEVQADPVRLNTNLGYYTNFVNLLDLAAVAIPAGFRPNGLPFGVTLMGPAFSEPEFLVLADGLHRQLATEIGKTGVELAYQPEVAVPNAQDVHLAVVGAHLDGQPLNGQLTQKGGRLVKSTRTARHYRLYALANTTPPKPGLVRVQEDAGNGIEVEVWALDTKAFGEFVAEVPPPLAIGNAVLEDGTSVKSFVCEPNALEGAEEITRFGGWRGYLKQASKELSG
jgi:allophanate hydrolase